MNTFEFYEDLQPILDKHNPEPDEIINIGMTLITKHAVEYNLSDERIDHICTLIKESINHFKENNDL